MSVEALTDSRPTGGPPYPEKGRKKLFFPRRLATAYGSEPTARRVGRRKRDLRVRHGLHGPVSAEVSQALQHAAELFELLELEKRRCLVRPIESSETLIGLTRLADLLKTAERDLARLVNARAADAADVLDEVDITDPSACAALLELAELAAGISAQAGAGATIEGEVVEEPAVDRAPYRPADACADAPGACASGDVVASGSSEAAPATPLAPVEENASSTPQPPFVAPSGAAGEPCSPSPLPERGVSVARPAERRPDTATGYDLFEPER